MKNSQWIPWILILGILLVLLTVRHQIVDLLWPPSTAELHVETEIDAVDEPEFRVVVPEPTRTYLQIDRTGEITFFTVDNEPIGGLRWEDGTLVFWGEADASAQIFFEVVRDLMNTMHEE